MVNATITANGTASIFHKEGEPIPRRVLNCPIVDATCEVRFEPTIPGEAVYGTVYSRLNPLFGKASNLPVLELPQNFRDTDPNLRHQPHYRFSKHGIVAQLGPRVVSVGSNEPYPGWEKLSENVRAAVNALREASVVKTVTRFGLRYINFIPGDVFEDIDMDIQVNSKRMVGKELSVSIVVEGRYSHLVRIRKDVQVRVDDSNPRYGSIVDIDSFVNSPSEGLAAFDSFLDEAHADEKRIFFGLLKPNFLKTLQPHYSDE